MDDKELTLVSRNHTWHVVVHQMTLRMSMRASHIADDMEANPVPDSGEQVMRQYFYPVLAACTTCEAGPVPTVEEFLDLPSVVANEWYAAVFLLNPEALPSVLGGAPEAVPEEKKESSQTSSSSGSGTLSAR